VSTIVPLDWPWRPVIASSPCCSAERQQDAGDHGDGERRADEVPEASGAGGSQRHVHGAHRDREPAQAGDVVLDAARGGDQGVERGQDRVDRRDLRRQPGRR